VVLATVCVYQDGKILCTKRSNQKKYLPNVWEVPGGHVNHDEHPVAAAKREVMEEVGLEVEIEKIFAVEDFIFPNNQNHAVNLFFLAKVVGNNEVKICEEEVSEYAWMDKAEFQEKFGNEKYEGDPRYVKCILEAFELIK